MLKNQKFFVQLCCGVVFFTYLCVLFELTTAIDMIRTILLSFVAAVVSTTSVFAYSGPSKLIPEPVEFSVSAGVYTLKPDGSDIKGYLGSRAFASMRYMNLSSAKRV